MHNMMQAPDTMTTLFEYPGSWVVELHVHVKLDIDNQPAGECKLPVATGSPHKWNKAAIGGITFQKSGLHLLTVHYGKGNNPAYLEFVLSSK